MFKPNQFIPGVQFKSDEPDLHGMIFTVVQKTCLLEACNSFMEDHWVWAEDNKQYQYIFHIDEITEIV